MLTGRSDRDFARTALAGFVLVACGYMFFLEPWGHDSWFHLQRLLDVEQQFGEGRLRAYMAGNAANGMGLPVWIYYSQWTYWPAIVFRALGASPLVSLKLIYCVALTICCVGCFRLLTLHAARSSAALGTLLFVTSNYVVGEIFQRAAYAEFLSVCFLPLVLACMYRVLVEGNRASGFFLVCLAGLMILFHPLSFMNAGIALVAYAAYVISLRALPPSRLLRLLPPFALALAVTAFFWLPAVIETRYVMGEEGVPTRLAQTFLGLGHYVNFSSITNVGLVLTVLLPAVTLSLFLRSSYAPRLRASWPLLAGIVVYVLLTLPFSAPVYESFPLLRSTLWVWRVLYPLTLLTVLFVAANLDVLPSRIWSRRARNGVVALAVGQAAVLVVWNSGSELSLRTVETAEIREELEGEWSRMAGFGIDEYMPRPGAAPYPSESCGAIQMPTNGISSMYELRVTLPPALADGCINIPRLWNVRYTAQVDGDQVPVLASASGEIVVLPGGRRGELVLRLRQPAWALVANLVSVATVVGLFIFLLSGYGRRRLRSEPGPGAGRL